MFSLAQPTTGEGPDVASPPELGAAERGILLDIARLALWVVTGVRPAVALERAVVATRAHPLGGLRAAAFVTLREAGDLRGCMGALDASRPLPEAVAEAAALAASGDPRFWPLAARELPDVKVEISVLGPFVKLAEADALFPGSDGVMVEGNGRAGLLLPEVATDHGWGWEQLLSAVCGKAGLAETAWRDRSTRLYAFRTVRFSGPACGSGRRPHGPPRVAQRPIDPECRRRHSM